MFSKSLVGYICRSVINGLTCPSTRLSDHQDPEPLHARGRIRGACPDPVHPSRAGRPAGPRREPGAGATAHGHTIQLPRSLPLQPLQHPAGRHRDTGEPQSTDAEESLEVPLLFT